MTTARPNALNTDLGSMAAIRKRKAELETEFLALESAMSQRAFDIADELGRLAEEEDWIKHHSK